MSKPIIIIVRNAYAYDFGGGERFPVFLAAELHKDFEPVIISRSQKLLSFAISNGIQSIRGWWWSQQNWSGRRVFLFPVYILWQVMLLGWYSTIFVKLRPSVVHLQSKDDFIAGTIAAKLVGARVLWTDHADLKHVWKNVEQPLRNPVGKLVLRAARYVDAITVVSRSELDMVRGNIANQRDILDKTMVVHNGVRDSRQDHLEELNKTGYTFCVASRLVVDKGIGEIILAFKTLGSSHPSAQLIIMGDGPDRAIFEDQASDDPRISLVGHVEQPLDVMGSSFAFVHPTYHEGFSVALVEASMMGLPIVATGVGGNVEIIKDGITGILVPAKDSGALATAMKKLVENPVLAKKLGQSARDQYLKEFEFSAIVKDHFLPLYSGGRR